MRKVKQTYLSSLVVLCALTPFIGGRTSSRRLQENISSRFILRKFATSSLSKSGSGFRRWRASSRTAAIFSEAKINVHCDTCIKYVFMYTCSGSRSYACNQHNAYQFSLCFINDHIKTMKTQNAHIHYSHDVIKCHLMSSEAQTMLFNNVTTLLVTTNT